MAILQYNPTEIHFTPPLNRNQCVVLEMRNLSSTGNLHFKIKTTAATRYTVRPNSGSIRPLQTQSLQITIYTTETAPSRDGWNDKFMIEYFLDTEPSAVFKEKLRVIFDLPLSQSQPAAPGNFAAAAAPPPPLNNSVLRPLPPIPVRGSVPRSPYSAEKCELKLRIHHQNLDPNHSQPKLESGILRDMGAIVGDVQQTITVQYSSENGHADEIIATLPFPPNNIDPFRPSPDSESVILIAGFVVRKQDNAMKWVEQVQDRFITNLFGWNQAQSVQVKGVSSLTPSGGSMYNLITSAKLPLSAQKLEIPRLKSKISVQCDTDLAKLVVATQNDSSSGGNMASFVVKMLQHMLDGSISFTSTVETLQYVSAFLQSQAQELTFRATTKHFFDMLSMMRKMDLDFSLRDLGASSDLMGQETRDLLNLLFGSFMRLFMPKMLSLQRPAFPPQAPPASLDSSDTSMTNSVFYQAFSGWTYLTVITERCSFKLTASPSSSEILQSLCPRVYQIQELLPIFQQLNVSSTPTELDIPESFIDPISSEIMEDPVVTADGHTYERSQIERWFQSHDTSPLTGLKLAVKTLIPNYLVRSQIKEFKEKHAAYFKDYHQ